MRGRTVMLLSLALWGCDSTREQPPPPGPADASNMDAEPTADAQELDDTGVEDASLAKDAQIADAAPEDAGETDTGVSPALPDPVVFVHGLNGSSVEFQTMIDRLIADGWPAERLFAIDFARPGFIGCNEDHAVELQMAVDNLLASTGASRVDLVAHSMGGVATRHYLKELNGAATTNTLVTLASMNQGVQSGCLAPDGVCVGNELCPDGAFMSNLNAPPARPGNIHWLNIYSTDDETVSVEEAHHDAAENVEVSGPTHAGPMGVPEDPNVYAEVKRGLEFPAW